MPSDAIVKCCAFRREAKGWTVSLTAARTVPPPRGGRRAVGVDLGITTFAALSDGAFVPSLRAARKGERRMRIAQRALARKQRSSRSRLKARSAVTRAHAAIARQRADHLHQASARLVRN